MEFQLLVHRAGGYEPVGVDAEGFARSQVLDRRVRLTRRLEEAGLVIYRLEAE